MDAPNMQSYPSPNAVAADQGPFYASSSNQQQQQQQQPQQPALPTPEDLQLTAQLSRGIAPLMTSGQGGNIADNHEARNHSLPNVNHQYEQEQAHATHIQANHGSLDHMGEHMGGQYSSHDGTLAPRKRSKVSRACDECRRKKIKCDASGEPGDDQCSNCKRVAVICQFSRVPMKRGPSKGYIKELADRLATIEGAVHGTDIGQQYIPHHESLQQPRASQEYSPPLTSAPLGKRTYSAISASGGDFGSPVLAQSSLSQWNQQESQRNTPQQASSFAQPLTGQHMFREPNYSPNGLQPSPQWRNAPETPRRLPNVFETSAPDSGHSPEWNEPIVDEYYVVIHSTYPILPNSKTKVLERLIGCPQPLREAFYEALHAAVRSYPSPNPPHEEPYSSRRAAQLITMSSQDFGSPRPFSHNITCLQAMLLMAIEADNRNPSTSSQGGFPRSVWLGSAVGLAYSMKLHLYKQPDRTAESDAETDDKLGRRIWWSLVIMDRWHASSTSSPLLIPDSSVVVYPEDQALLGENLYHLARLSIILGHISAVMLVPLELPPFSVASGPIYGTLLRGELERFRETLPVSFFPPSNAPLVHICYWHLRLLVDLTLPDAEPSDLLTSASRIVLQLVNNQGLVAPLTYQSTTLAALALLDLTEHEATREEAGRSLQPLIERSIAPSSWDVAVRDLIVSRMQSSPESKHASVASQSLQRLADLATATEEGRDVAVSEERKEGEKANTSGPTGAHFRNFKRLRELVKNGYLSVFTAEPAR
ncbi:C6 finger domain-containing protein [Diplocarpon rosae]|nr:C6 finger domain-containing protein [Diplocarpon rosae]